MKKKKEIKILILLVLLLIIINYNFLDEKIGNIFSEKETIVVKRIIDGDTIEAKNQSIRLLGMNTPERGEPFYEEAKEFLESLILNKTVKLEFGKEKYDKYRRLLGYVFLNGENVNIKLVEEGLANIYFPSGKDKYYDKFLDSWEKCIENNQNLCEDSDNYCKECVELKSLNVKSQEIIFYNKCSFDCNFKDWEIKDEGRKKFIFDDFVLNKNEEVRIIVGEGIDGKNKLFWKDESYVFTKTGDTIFLRDDKGKLILWENY